MFERVLKACRLAIPFADHVDVSDFKLTADFINCEPSFLYKNSSPQMPTKSLLFDFTVVACYNISRCEILRDDGILLHKKMDKVSEVFLRYCNRRTVFREELAAHDTLRTKVVYHFLLSEEVLQQSLEQIENSSRYYIEEYIQDQVEQAIAR